MTEVDLSDEMLAFLVGVVAAVVPAWRATKLDILQAIATE